ncbi:hypothetical protein CMQ_857 [Grosmannia clavigera kw1407]|uniref:Uncharacterized protein n=1 Tax=Grosmannia clavigera (strain kw1407 / UAMH 11150) TaxID=655863 RepID=F0XF91_GROCL|nr:uncharacterized protein CMQ_857 [Grosmannia clavigera kw1407]EFX03929.1 hypothetical protein CMQ_857 [Grosmannia clavigera kw1407]
MQDAASSSGQHASASETTTGDLGTACGVAAIAPPPPLAAAIRPGTAMSTSTSSSMPSSVDTTMIPSGGPSAPEASRTAGATSDADEAATDTGTSDESIYGDQDDAQSFIQPTISPMATRLSLPQKQSLAERVNFMAGGVGGDGTNGGSPNLASRRSQTSRTALLHAAARQNRSSSVGSDALKRLSKALPSLSFPKGSSTFFPSLPTPSFLSAVTSPTSPASRKSLSTAQNQQRQPTVASQQPSSYSHHRSTSDDSMLYQTLSRVSSLGDDDNFDNIREQVNSRVKAIMDSFPDRPTFKLPSFFPDGKSSAGASAPREPASSLDIALESLTGDVVVMGGYRGSILRSAEPPHRQLWVPVKVGLNIRKVNMEIGLDREDELNMDKSIFASGMLKNIGPVDISRRLFKKLRECENARHGKLRVHDYGYDWRLSPHLLSKRLNDFLETLPSNKLPLGSAGRGALVISHSLGGLITRHAVNQRPDLYSGVIYVGTPMRCINILGPLRNGDAVLLNEKVLTAQVNFSLRTTFVFLPEDGFCFVNTNDPDEEYRVDYYDVQEWIRYRLSPCIGPPALPPAHQDGSGVLKRSSTIGALLEDLSGSLPSLPLRNRISSGGIHGEGTAERTLAPQMNSLVSPSSSSSSPSPAASTFATATTTATTTATQATQTPPPPSPRTHHRSPSYDPAADTPQRARSLAYLERTLAETKRFRAELAHRPEHTVANGYPPTAVIYGKGIPTVFAARVANRESIARSDAFDDLVFRSGDGVVLTRESMVPDGYHVVRDGYVSSDRGHVSLLGDHAAVGRAIEAVIRGRTKGIGLGLSAATAAAASAMSREGAEPVAMMETGAFA